MRRLAERGLRAHNTFRVATQAGDLIVLERPEDLAAVGFDASRDLLLGGGSNVLLTDDIPGRVYLVRLPGRRILKRDDDSVLIEAGAGEDWDDLVAWSIEQGLSGLENLSLIPGSVGAAPIQNIGAYGVELAEHLESVRAWDWRERAWRRFSREACRFAYRDSRFKSLQPDRYLVASIRLRLDRRFRPRLGYAGLTRELGERGVDQPTAADVRQAVIAIRRRKLPDPAQIGNAGSFFKNPVLPSRKAQSLQRRHPGLVMHPDGSGRHKLSAAWLIERAGWKGFRRGDAGVSDRHALVLVNHGAATGAELWRLAMNIRRSVRDRFGIELECEPRVVPQPGSPRGRGSH